MEKKYGGLKSEIIKCDPGEIGFIAVILAAYIENYDSVYVSDYEGLEGTSVISYKKGREVSFTDCFFDTFEKAQGYIDSTLEALEKEGHPVEILESRVYIATGNGTAMPFGHQN